MVYFDLQFEDQGFSSLSPGSRSKALRRISGPPCLLGLRKTGFRRVSMTPESYLVKSDLLKRVDFACHQSRAYVSLHITV